MKTYLKLAVILLAGIFMASCKAGSYSISTGLADQAAISLVSAKAMPLVLDVDGQRYEINSVAQKAWKKNRDIKKTALNTVTISTGRHSIKVYAIPQDAGETLIYQHEIFVSVGEHKIIEL